MSKRLTVFYSWQSDTPSSLNRNFIEKALREALSRLQADAALEIALRDTKVELEKDTKGVAGSPPIADTILKKIEECAVFVADLTFVASSLPGLTNSSGQPRLVPNPNVLIEYGYAIRCHSHSAIVGVMNTSFGEPNEQTLPFDLRHLRWPIAYYLSLESNSTEKSDQLEKLTATLVEAIRLILTHNSAAQESTAAFAPQKPTKNLALFHEDMHDLISEDRWRQRSGAYVIPEGGKLYLRLYPTRVVHPIETELEAVELAGQGGLQPIGKVTGWDAIRNVFGCIVREAPKDGKLYHFTQLFLSREIWGVDAHVLAEALHEWQEMQGMPELVKFIASGFIEPLCINALTNYLSFAKLHLKLQLPLRVEAGLVGIKGYTLAVGTGFHGSALHDDVRWTGEVTSEKPAWEILSPFFDRVWANCNVRRTPVHQAELAQKFGQRL